MVGQKIQHLSALVQRDRGQGKLRKKLGLSSKLHSGSRVTLRRRERKGREVLPGDCSPGQLITRTEHFQNSWHWVQEYSPCHSSYITASLEVLLGCRGPGPGNRQPRARLPCPLAPAGPYPSWICPEYMVRSSMMVKPVKRPRFWMTNGMKMLPFLSSSWQTSFISGNWGRRDKQESCSSFPHLVRPGEFSAV